MYSSYGGVVVLKNEKVGGLKLIFANCVVCCFMNIEALVKDHIISPNGIYNEHQMPLRETLARIR